MSDQAPSAAPSNSAVVVYSDDAAVRDQVRSAVGRRPAADVGRIDWIECATGQQVLAAVDAGGVDAVVLDGEAWPTGGLGLAKQMKDELADCPPVCVLIARHDDRWLATWSQADAVVPHPIDPAELTGAVAELLRRREAGLPVRRAVH
jgi:DNA-binding response OmpR family regulator